MVITPPELRDDTILEMEAILREYKKS